MGQEFTVYTDGSFQMQTAAAGAGAVLVSGDELSLRGINIQDCTSSTMAEIKAAVFGLELAMEIVEEGDDITFFIDHQELVKQAMVPYQIFPPSVDVGELISLIGAYQERGVRVHFSHVKAHGNGLEKYDDRNSILNGVSHCLATLSRKGNEINECIKCAPHEEAIISAVEVVHEDLNPILERERRITFSIAEACDYIGIDEEFVRQLVLEGHISLSTDLARLYKSQVKNVKKVFDAMKNKEIFTEEAPTFSP